MVKYHHVINELGLHPCDPHICSASVIFVKFFWNQHFQKKCFKIFAFRKIIFFLIFRKIFFLNLKKIFFLNQHECTLYIGNYQPHRVAPFHCYFANAAGPVQKGQKIWKFWILHVQYIYNQNESISIDFVDMNQATQSNKLVSTLKYFKELNSENMLHIILFGQESRYRYFINKKIIL